MYAAVPKFWISTTIKKKHLDRILSGLKTSELKGCNDYWFKRIEKHLYKQCGEVGLNLLCGQDAYKFLVKQIDKWVKDDPVKIDDDEYTVYYDIGLGVQLIDMSAGGS